MLHRICKRICFTVCFFPFDGLSFRRKSMGGLGMDRAIRCRQATGAYSRCERDSRMKFRPCCIGHTHKHEGVRSFIMFIGLVSVG
ncbi:hypothetical protein DAPPUDRAFT_226762 [Daphnia pulex]|uniref:Uncharacterized protein n=1 Tax=Daphnia pulex TaxID=6669 RepID=E9H1C4_DAPPU|nr:hypothetical protein DAPPUDRAFT_226762 [Daphnia pulex]|eukprot:EFX74443.1 hypothetical protein DAPPUDRAFT_226762 [Daphnia pulex]